MAETRSLHTIEATTGEAVDASIIWMHGLGADGRDFLPLAQELDLSPVAVVRYVFPNAPVIPVTINGGMPMPAWYDIRAADLVRREDEAGLRRSCAEITALIDREVQRGVPAQRIVLAGFSQGCAMALMAGLRYPATLAGIMGLSGYLPLAETTAAEHSPASLHTPVWLAHGEHDGIVPMARAESSAALLRGLGHTVAWSQYPMEHSVCPAEVRDIEAWLRQVLARRGL
jgi:phospholipase/carboxylesterase